MLLTLCSAILFLLLGLPSYSERPREGLLVIPGLGRPDRLDTVLSNLDQFKHKLNGSEPLWECIVYVYAPREWKVLSSSFWYAKGKLEHLQSMCKIIENPNKRVTENLHMVQPALIKHAYQYVFVLLDDCELRGDGGYFDIDRILAVMEANELTLASPYVAGANKGGGQQFRNIMQTPAIAGTEGYVSTFVEMFAWVMTIPAYEALWHLLCPSVNPYGWGYDLWYDNYAKRRVIGHKMGIVSGVKAFHQQDLNKANRTDDTNPEIKWKGLVFQERHYQTFYGVTLHKYRETMDLKNTSWNGAVIGYLKVPDPEVLQERRERRWKAKKYKFDKRLSNRGGSISTVKPERERGGFNPYHRDIP